MGRGNPYSRVDRGGNQGRRLGIGGAAKSGLVTKTLFRGLLDTTYAPSDFSRLNVRISSNVKIVRASVPAVAIT